MDLPFPTDVYQFIVFLGSPLAVGVIVSMLLEKLPIWHAPPLWLAKFERVYAFLDDNYPRVKATLVYLMAQSLPVLSTWILSVARPEHFSLVQPVVNFLLAGLVVWFGVTTFHDNRPEF